MLGCTMHNEIPGFGKVTYSKTHNPPKAHSVLNQALDSLQRARLHHTRETLWDLKCRTLAVRLPRQAFDAPSTN